MHDYFLLNFMPEDSIGYYHGTLIKKDVLKAEIFFSINKQGQAVSIPNAPFGGIIIHGTLASETICFFIREIKSAMKTLKVVTLTIVQPPICYCIQSDLIGYILNSEGFSLKKILTHQFFEGKKKLRKTSIKLNFKSTKKQKEADLQVSVGSIQNFLFLDDIKNWNHAKGHTSVVNENLLIHQVSNFPDRYFVISVVQEGKAISHALAVKLTGNSLYYYLSASNPKILHKVTGEIVMANLFELASQLKADFLDLGSSDLGGRPNHTLIFYKSKYTNTYHNKHTWQIEF
jgi:hypothetical protein